jgi:MFS family permease
VPKRFALAPVALVEPVRQHVRKAVKERRIGNFSADRGLDLLTFFLADVQTGFGPFIAVYLTEHKWTAEQIGAVLGVGSIVSMAAQVPAGAGIDATPLKRGATLVGLLAVMGSALLLALFPERWPVIGAEVLHGIASCMLMPAIAAVTLSRVGRAAFSRRLGRNARCMALGNGIGAVLMGVAGAHIAASAPFWLAAVFTVPAVLALLALPPRHETEPPPPRRRAREAALEAHGVLTSRRLLVFALCVLLFFVANGFLLPLAMNRLAGRIRAGNINEVLAACLLLAQAMVALISPWMGRKADDWGRRRVLMLGFAAVPVHAALLAVFGNLYAVIGLEVFDGMGGAMYGVLQPLVAADITKGTNRYNLVLGVLGLFAGLGTSAGQYGGGWLATHFGFSVAFAVLAAIGALAVLLVWLLLPETKPDDGSPKQEKPDGVAQVAAPA